MFGAAVRVLKLSGSRAVWLAAFTSGLAPLQRFFSCLLRAQKQLGWPSRRGAWGPKEETDERILMRTNKETRTLEGATARLSLTQPFQ